VGKEVEERSMDQGERRGCKASFFVVVFITKGSKKQTKKKALYEYKILAGNHYYGFGTIVVHRGAVSHLPIL
jgi:hypothetical protein